MTRSIKALMLLALVAFATSMVRGVAAPPPSSVIVSCPFGSPGGDDLTRGFYVTSYPGSNLATVHVQYSASPSGTYTISMTARRGAFNGPIIGSTQTVTVNLPSISSELDVFFNFGGAPVPPGSTITFTQKQIAGPGTAYFNTGSGPCSGVSETNGTTPPLDTVRRNSVGLQISELTGASTDWEIESVSAAPPAPQVGQPVAFSAVLIALSSSGSYPQNVHVDCTIDGSSCGSGTLSYPGPTGVPSTVSAQTAWIATPGTHKLTWSAATVGDPNPSNNMMSIIFTVAPQAPFDFSISTSPSQQSVVPGGTTTYSVTVNLASGNTQNVALSLTGAPAGVSGTFSPLSGTPPFSSTLSVTTTSAVTPGTVTLTITGSGGGVTHSAQVTLVVSQAPDFTLDANPASQSASQGQIATYTIHVHALNGFNALVSLAISGAPSGTNAVLSVPSATPDFDSTLTITLSPSAPTGPVTLTITGSGGGQSHQINLVLIINPTTLTQTQTSTATTQTSTMQTSGSNDLWSMIQQNILLLAVGALIVLLLVAVITMRTRRKLTQPPDPTTAGTLYCSQCGTQNPPTNQFCGKCGAKLR
jgi:hypothetical protein